VYLHWHVGQYLRSSWIRNLVQEFQAPVFRKESELHFELLLLAAVALLVPLLARRRIVESLWILFWVHQALNSARHIPVFAVVVAPVVASEITLWWDRAVSGKTAGSLAGIFARLARDTAPGLARTSVWAPLLVLLVIAGIPSGRWPRDFPEAGLPVKIVRSHAALLAGARILTSDQWGDYLIYRFYPRQRVFVDGRSDFYGPAIGNQYLHLAYAHADWEKILAQHGFELVLSPVEWPLASLLRIHPGWRVVAEDRQAVLFARSGRAEAAGPPPGANGIANPTRGLMKTTDPAEIEMGDRRRT
jgi:hypothetical protein